MNDAFYNFEKELKEYGKKKYKQEKLLHKLTFVKGKCEFCSRSNTDGAHIIEKNKVRHVRDLKKYKFLLDHPANQLSACKLHHYAPYLDRTRSLDGGYDDGKLSRREKRAVKKFNRRLLPAFVRKRKTENRNLVSAAKEDIDRMRDMTKNLNTFNYEVNDKAMELKGELTEYANKKFEQIVY